ncbi:MULTISPECIES: YhgE/Pip domain-containing protein [unclassified Corynebacterium]|uniref:YhgE/Pip domain-containing protein n=1 Tax=Corynebacterium TaxID=1716 RepID=UPI00254D3FB2|nr:MULTISPECIES: YhgE/Pip domain-containing protein [unclassified Corynebacterium]MDK8476558.1 YhgE/Pip domain-containing protein [Corynebacterium sp. MSK310]MDK8492028.1 YhgE/Pip domain-containing protein [Corynebacterium sp. MSK175]MDK8672810.1 YhgE/Pip domain-containing protein [Corynebacterium sp. MSK189]
MITSWKLFLQDFVRLWRTPQVWVILIGLMVTPALYSWVNVSGFWDPYGNTEHLKVAVVNEDKGASSDLTGDIDVGGQMMEKLHNNDKLGWQFMDRGEAEHAVKSGDVFASIIVPEDFSSDFVSLFQGTYSQPTLEYQVNEKINAIAPKVTDTGSSTLETTISATFNENVAKSVSTELRNSGGDLSDRINSTAGNTANSFSETADTVANSRNSLADVNATIDDARPTIAQARTALGSVQTTIDDAQQALNQVTSLTDEVQKEVTSFADDATAAYIQGTTALADGTANANANIGSVTGRLNGALNRVDAATDGAQGILGQADKAIDQLAGVAALPALPPEISQQINQSVSDLRDRNNQNRAVLGELDSLNSDTNATLDSLNKTSELLDSMASQARDDSHGLRDDVANGLPKLNSALSNVSATAGRLSASLNSQKALVGQTDGLLGGVDGQLTHAQEVVKRFSVDLDRVEEGLRSARTDVIALSNTANNNTVLKSVNGLDTDHVSSFLSSPAEMESHAVFPVTHYGSGMSSLFINLTLWIGAFMLLIIFRAEVDPQGRRDLTINKAYFSRFLLLGFFAIAQALIVSIGNLVIGVEHVSATAYVLTSVFISLCYLSITYGLVSTFGHVGRGIAVVLAFIQIPGASGLYPIEMTPDFFRAVHPFLPFTYGIDAMRETVGGFYGTHYIRDIAALTGMAVVAYLVGTLLRRGLSNVTMLVNDELAKGGLVINEQVHLIGSRYRFTDLLYASADREGYQKSLDTKWMTARKNYSQLMKLTIAIGVALVLALVICSRFMPDQKAILFGIACLVALIAVAVICSLEYVKQSIAHDNRLADLSDEEIQQHLEHQRQNPNQYRLEDVQSDKHAEISSTPQSQGDTTDKPAVDGEESGKGDKS